MGRDRHGPPLGLTEEERRRWLQWRKFVWSPGDIVILKEGDRNKPGEKADEGRDDERPEDAGTR